MSPRPRPGALDWSTGLLAFLVVAAAVTVYVRDGGAKFLEILTIDAWLFVNMLPNLLAGCLVGAFIALLLPREMVNRWVGAESGFTGILIATLAGAILPGGPFTIYPIAATLAMLGADIGAIVALIVSWSLLGYSRALIWELPFFGVDFVGWRVLLATPLPFIAGLLARPIARAIGARLRDP
ncbi:MAG TPA: permease [Xanthobacteraceae bacterium]|nr:permease [Xanthobacteraceae bacterium]